MNQEPIDLDRHLQALGSPQQIEPALLPSERVFTALRAQVTQELTAAKRPSKRTWPQGSRLQRSLLSAAVVAAALSFGSLATLGPRSRAGLCLGLLTAISLLLGGVAGSRLVLSPWHRRLSVVGIPVLLLLFLGFSAGQVMTVREFLVSPAVTRAVSCLGHAGLTGGLVALCLVAIWRRTDPFAPRASAAFLGVLGGLAGALSVQLSCSSAEGLHLMLGHGLVALLLAAVGLLWGQKWMSP